MLFVDLLIYFIFLIIGHVLYEKILKALCSALLRVGYCVLVLNDFLYFHDLFIQRVELSCQ